MAIDNMREILEIKEFQEGIDYEIVSFSVMDDNFDSNSLFDEIEMKGTTFFAELGIEKDFYKQTKKYFQENLGKYFSIDMSLSPRFTGSDLFYIPFDEIDFSAAELFGFGVIKFIDGQYKGEYALYNYNRINEVGFERSDDIQEIIALNMYFTYTIEGFYDRGLEQILLVEKEMSLELISSNQEEVYQYLLELCKKRKTTEVIEKESRNT